MEFNIFEMMKFVSSNLFNAMVTSLIGSPVEHKQNKEEFVF